jgi:hypothetical protein
MPMRSFFAFVLSLLFLLPQTEYAIHAFQHKDDLHCAIKGSHYCTPKHKCDLCDYSQPDITAASGFRLSSEIDPVRILYFFAGHKNFQSQSSLISYLRGPPLS